MAGGGDDAKNNKDTQIMGGDIHPVFTTAAGRAECSNAHFLGHQLVRVRVCDEEGGGAASNDAAVRDALWRPRRKRQRFIFDPAGRTTGFALISQ